MLKRLYILLLVLFPTYSFAQNVLPYDSIEQRIVHEDCDDKIFYKVEISPALKKGIKDFEDTLSSCLNWPNVFQTETKITFKFLLTTSLHIFDLEKEYGNIQNVSAVKEAITTHSFMWKSAIQNGRLVCALVHLDIEYIKDKLIVTIKQ